MKLPKFSTNFSEEFKAQFTYLRENTEKCIAFSFPIKKEI